MGSENSNVIEIDIGKLILACLKKWWAILLAMILCGGVVFAATYFLITPQYKSTIKLYVNNSSISSQSTSVTSSDISASTSLVNVYAAILNTKDTLDQVIEQANLPYEYSQLESMISPAAVHSPQVFQVTVTDPSPEEAQLIASTIGDVLPDVIGNIIESSDTRIVENATFPTDPSSPSYKKNILLGVVVGFCLSVLVIVIRSLLDNTIHSEKDFEEITGVPVIARIPDFTKQGKKSSGGKYGYGYGYGYSKSSERS